MSPLFISKVKLWRWRRETPEDRVRVMQVLLGWSYETTQEVLDILEYARLQQVEERVSDMESVLGRPAVPGDGCFSVGV